MLIVISTSIAMVGSGTMIIATATSRMAMTAISPRRETAASARTIDWVTAAFIGGPARGAADSGGSLRALRPFRRSPSAPGRARDRASGARPHQARPAVRARRQRGEARYRAGTDGRAGAARQHRRARAALR